MHGYPPGPWIITADLKKAHYFFYWHWTCPFDKDGKILLS